MALWQLFSLALGNKIIDLLYGRPRTRVTRSSFSPRGLFFHDGVLITKHASPVTIITFRVHFLKVRSVCVAGGFLDSTHHPPDVPPRNHPSMNRLNGRSTTGLNPDGDFEPSCLVRTPSGNVYIPTGERVCNLRDAAILRESLPRQSLALILEINLTIIRI